MVQFLHRLLRPTWWPLVERSSPVHRSAPVVLRSSHWLALKPRVLVLPLLAFGRLTPQWSISRRLMIIGVLVSRHIHWVNEVLPFRLILEDPPTCEPVESPLISIWFGSNQKFDGFGNGILLRRATFIERANLGVRPTEVATLLLDFLLPYKKCDRYLRFIFSLARHRWRHS